jgi:hypothetical protein
LYDFVESVRAAGICGNFRRNPDNSAKGFHTRVTGLGSNGVMEMDGDIAMNTIAKSETASSAFQFATIVLMAFFTVVSAMRAAGLMA